MPEARQEIKRIYAVHQRLLSQLTVSNELDKLMVAA